MTLDDRIKHLKVARSAINEINTPVEGVKHQFVNDAIDKHVEAAKAAIYKAVTVASDYLENEKNQSA